jgi:hypothetical protein
MSVMYLLHILIGWIIIGLYFFVVQDEDMDDADGSPVDGILANQHQDMHNSLPAEGLAFVDAYAGDNLVTPPCKVHTSTYKSPLHSTTVASVLRWLTGALFQMFGFFLD